MVSGSDATAWLNDLVSASVDGTEVRRSLLLTPTGRIRAEFHVARFDGGRVLVQDPVQPRPIDELLAPYVLSSDVDLEPVADMRLFAVPHRDELGIAFGKPDGDPGDYEEWRIRRGIPRFGVDLDEESLPQEAGWETLIDFTKGCFMGQEAMARIQNFGGHPTRVIRALRAERVLTPGDRVVGRDGDVGLVTSVSGPYVIARVSWAAREETIATESGVQLLDR